MRAKKHIAIVFFLAAIFLTVGFTSLWHTGWTGATEKTGGSGCICHSLPVDSVKVWIEGPRKVLPSTAHQVRLFMAGGPAQVGGFNAAIARGALAPVDTFVLQIEDELTHRLPRSFVNDTVSWLFEFTSSSATGLDTIFSAGNSTNNSGDNTGDQFNFGEKFIVEVTSDTVLSVAEKERIPSRFDLEQNYPNPFNPVTSIRFQVPGFGLVSLRVYDVLGKEVATLINEWKQAGSHSIRWDASDRPSGVYYYRLEAGKKALARKMLLLK